VTIDFRPSPRPTLGIEVELGIVDRGTRELSNASTELLGVLGIGHPGDEHPKVKHELFESTVEIITGICTTVAEAGQDLRASITEVDRLTRERGLGLVSAGTHPFSRWHDQRVSPDPRYADLVERIGWPARRLAIHGTHFHVGVHSGQAAVAVTGGVAVHLPLFLALSASSPYWQSHDTGLASVRTKVFEGLPTAGLPPQLVDWADFEAFMGTLMTAGAINSIREVWWDVRPHPDFGTVELRMCDAMPTLTEVLSVAALAQCLVSDLQDRFERDGTVPTNRDWVLRENKWLAARYGLEAQVIVDDLGTRRPARDAITDLVAELTPTAAALGCSDELAGVLDIVERGPGYERQRRVLRGGGAHVDVVDLLLEEFETDEVRR
jgi:glutamate---cysteine ligase / carboxylate-amine ligase